MGHTFEFRPYVAPRKIIQDSIGFWIPRHGFRISVSEIWIPDSNWSLAGSPIPWALYWILKPKIPDFIGKNPLIPESEFP